MSLENRDISTENYLESKDIQNLKNCFWNLNIKQKENLLNCLNNALTP